MAEKCIEQVLPPGEQWGRTRRCERKPGHGPDGKYCAQHAEKFAQGETQTWYRAKCFSDYSFEITPVEVLKATDSAVLLKSENGRATRESRHGKWHCYFPTHAEAVAFYRNRIAGLRKRADELEAKLPKDVK